MQAEALCPEEINRRPMTQGKWCHQLLELSPAMARDEVQAEGKVLGGQVAKVLNCCGDGNECKDYQVSWLLLTAPGGVQKETRN